MTAWLQPIRLSRRISVPSLFRVNVPAGFPTGTSYELGPPHPIDGWLSLLCHSIAQTPDRQYRNIEPVAHHLRLSASA